MKASDIFVKALENEGVEVIFGIPGEENLDLLESLYNSKIKFILCRHEQAAAFMAATYGRLKEKAGVCLSTLGPGATNLVTGAAYAQLGGMPVLMITGQKPVKSSKQANFQILDVVEMMGPLTKKSKSLISGNEISFEVRRSFRAAEAERPGVTHLELPEDIAQEEVENHKILPINTLQEAEASHDLLMDVCKKVQNSKSPVIVIGSEANRKSCCTLISSLVHDFEIPFISTQMGKGVVDENSSYYIGNATVSSGSIIHEALEEADLILNIGYHDIEKPPFFMNRIKAEVIHINYTPAKIDELYYPDMEVVGSISKSVSGIYDNLQKKNWGNASIFKLREVHHNILNEKSDDNSFPIFPQRIIGSIQQYFPKDGILSLDNGMYKLWFARYFKSNHSKNLLLDNALASMGAGLPSAIAAKYLYPEKKVMAICGDGGFMMNSQELETAQRLKIDLVILIILDNEMGMIRWKQEHENFHDYALDFGNPNFKKLAEAYGGKGYEITSTQELDELIQRLVNEKGIHIITIPIDYSDNAVFNAKIEEEEPQ